MFGTFFYGAFESAPAIKKRSPFEIEIDLWKSGSLKFMFRFIVWNYDPLSKSK